MMTKIHRLRFNEQKEGKRDKNGINTSKKLNLHLVHSYLLSVSVSNLYHGLKKGMCYN